MESTVKHKRTYDFSGKTLYQLRLENGFSMQDLAKKIGVSIPSVFQWESDKFKPKPCHLQKLCKLFKVKMSAFQTKGLNVA